VTQERSFRAHGVNVKPANHQRPQGWFLAAAGMLLVSTDSIFVRWADTDAWTIAFLVGVCGVVTQGLGLRFHERLALRKLIVGSGRPLWVVGVLGALTQLAFIASITFTEIANAVAIVGAMPLMAAMAAFVVLGERPGVRVMFAITVTIIGVLIIVAGSIRGPNLVGDLLAVGAIIGFSGVIVTWRQHPDLSRFGGLALSSAIMAAVSLPLVNWAAIPGRTLVACLGMGLIFNPLGRLLHSTAPRYASSAEVALFTPTETVAATLWAVIFFQEWPSWQTFAGGLTIVIGVFVGTVGELLNRQDAHSVPST